MNTIKRIEQSEKYGHKVRWEIINADGSLFMRTYTFEEAFNDCQSLKKKYNKDFFIE